MQKLWTVNQGVNNHVTWRSHLPDSPRHTRVLAVVVSIAKIVGDIPNIDSVLDRMDSIVVAYWSDRRHMQGH